VLVYVDDIIFGSNNASLVQWFASTMHYEFEMYMIGEMPFFLGLQITHRSEGIFFFSGEISKRNVEKASNGRFYTYEHTYGHWMQVKKG
jgi:hypothetical protein